MCGVLPGEFWVSLPENYTANEKMIITGQVLEIWCLGSGNGGVSVVVRGGDMVVSGGLKGCLDNRILRSSLILPPILLDLGIVYVRCVGV
ncbi:hypothetical protein Tco_1093930 [Tanacetum coccineum]|uniref:Uncharacterized protein n=1 Tax=Tanacetum coccineum TaxID=301880 RepID=A0ABQ5IG81_9ASTR